MVTLKDVMTRHFEFIHPDVSAQDALRKMETLNLSMLPVCEGEHVVGVLADPQFGDLPTVAQDPRRVRVRDIMTPEVLTGTEDQDVREVIPIMRKRDIQTLPVLDADERMVGIFSLGGPWRRSRS